MGSEVAVDEGSVTQQISEARVAIPSQSWPISIRALICAWTSSWMTCRCSTRTSPVEPGLADADQLRSHIEGNPNGLGLSVDLEGVGTDALELVLQTSAGDITTDIDFESSFNAQTGTLSVTSFEIPPDLSAGDTLTEFHGQQQPGWTPAAVTLTADFDPISLRRWMRLRAPWRNECAASRRQPRRSGAWSFGRYCDVIGSRLWCFGWRSVGHTGIGASRCEPVWGPSVPQHRGCGR